MDFSLLFAFIAFIVIFFLPTSYCFASLLVQNKNWHLEPRDTRVETEDPGHFRKWRLARRKPGSRAHMDLERSGSIPVIGICVKIHI